MVFRYDNGSRANLRATFGETWIEWLSVTRPAGEGHHEQVSTEFLHSLDKGEVHFNILDDTDSDSKTEREKKLDKIV